jgi:PAS domain S-box-containing protein
MTMSRKKPRPHDPLNGLPCFFVSFSDDGTILSTNDTVLDLLGFERGELEGKPLDAIFPTGGRVFYQTHLYPLMKLQGSVEEIYFVLRAKNGAEVPVLIYGARREKERPPSNDCVFIRITRREHIQDELARVRERLIGVLGHDLRVPMTSAAFGLETLVRREKLSPEGQRLALASMASARRAARMTMDLLDFARVRFAGGIPIDRQPADLRVTVEKVIAELTTIHPAVSLVLEVQGDVRGSWDADRAAQVAANLISNAIEHGHEGTPVEVSLEGGPDSVVLEVRNAADTPPAELFAPFQGGRRSSGLGLGLFIVREIMQAHGGTVDAVDEGGEFRVRALWPRAMKS